MSCQEAYSETVTTKKRGKHIKKSIKYSPTVNPLFQDEVTKKQISDIYTQKSSYTFDDGSLFHAEPFSLCMLKRFVSPENFMDHLKEELADQIFYEKNNDLYKFQQTDDLKKLSGPYIKATRNFLRGDVRKWLTEVTGIPLNERVDITCSRYDYTDTLLCHDDELDTRRIAFVLYLVPTWKAEDGGALDMFDMDEHMQPRDVVKSIFPAFNQLVWFEVTEGSHHQVSEVLCKCKSRLSVNGWFHADPVPRAKRYMEPKLPLQGWLQVEEDAFYEWINPIYLDPEVQAQIQEKFENDSEIELQGFLQDEKYQAVVDALRSEQIQWKTMGPPNKRHYEQGCREGPKPAIIDECLAFLQSEMMFLTLANLTGLTLHPLAAQSDSENESDLEGQCSSTCGVGVGTVKRSGVVAGSKDTDVCSVSNKNSIEADLSDSANEDVGSDGQCNGNNERERSKPSSKRRKLDTECSDTAEMSGNKVVEGSPVPQCRAEVRRWSPGSYTLVHDTDIENKQFALDAMLFCNCQGWEESFGGFTSYIAKGEDEELLTVIPSENSLALVYRDKDTLRFVKHINDSVNESKTDSQFYDFSLVYVE